MVRYKSRTIAHVFCVTAATLLFVSRAAEADWTWNAADGDPSFEVGGDIPPCDAFYDAGIPAYVLDYPAPGSGDNVVAASLAVGDFSSDLQVTISFDVVEASYDLAFLLTEPDFDPREPSLSNYLRTRFHNGFDVTMHAGSRNDDGFTETDIFVDHPQSGSTYQVEFGRETDTLYAKFYELGECGFVLIASAEWTEANPTAALTDLYIVGSADHGFDDGLSQITNISVVGASQPDWITWEVSEGGNGHRYALTEGIDWPDAEAAADAAGGHLVTINDEMENEWVVFTFAPLVTDQVWMGFNQLGTPGHWEWIGETTDPGEHWDGGWWEAGNPSSTSYTNWASGQPGGAEEYGLLIVIGDGTWHDHYGPAGFQGIIEAPPAPCDGDANGDGVVDPLDSGFVLARFGCVVGCDPGCAAADQNGDGLVDPLDVGFVLARFGECP